MAPRDNQRLTVPTMPDGTEVASYKTYLEASDAVDHLSDEGFDVKSITIVGTDLHMVERVTGRLTAGKVAASGAGSGALWGAFMGLMLSFAAPGQGAGLWLAIGMAGGALFGVLMSVVLYAMTGGRRDFTSQSQVVASRYAVLASSEIDQAFKLLQATAGNQMRPAPRRRREPRTGPTEYGSRSDEQPKFGVRTSVQSSTESVGEAASPAAPAVPPDPSPESVTPTIPPTGSNPYAVPDRSVGTTPSSPAAAPEQTPSSVDGPDSTDGPDSPVPSDESRG